jgi:hypothetical protein
MKKSHFTQLLVAIWEFIHQILPNLFSLLVKLTLIRKASIKRQNDFHNQIILIGDDFIYGVGDSKKLAHPMGVMRYLLNRLASKLPHNIKACLK